MLRACPAAKCVIIITKNKLEKLKRELEKVIDYENDQVAIYEFDTLRYSSKHMIGYHVVTDNVL